MNHPLSRSRRTRAAAFLVVGVAGMMLASGCSEDTTDAQPAPTPSVSSTIEPRPTGTGGSPAASQPVADAVDRSNADAVAEAALIVMYSYDTTIDNGPNDTARRALPLLSEQFAVSVTQDRPVSGAGATWTEWAEHAAYVTPVLTPGADERPPDSATTARRQYQVSLSPTGPDGWIGEQEEETVFVTLTNESAEGTSRWAVEEVQVG